MKMPPGAENVYLLPPCARRSRKPPTAATSSPLIRKPDAPPEPTQLPTHPVRIVRNATRMNQTHFFTLIRLLFGFFCLVLPQTTSPQSLCSTFGHLSVTLPLQCARVALRLS